MSERRVLLCGPALNADESADRLEMFSQIDLPGATKFVVTTGKFDAQKLARTFNVEADYPAEPACLQTMAGWAEVADRTGPCFRDGYDLFCLRRILAKDNAFEYAVILRDAANLEVRWPELQAQVSGRPYVCFGNGSAASSENLSGYNVMFNMQEDSASGCLELAWELYGSGAVYGMSPYSLETALATALDSLSLALELGVKQN